MLYTSLVGSVHNPVYPVYLPPPKETIDSSILPSYSAPIWEASPIDSVYVWPPRQSDPFLTGLTGPCSFSEASLLGPSFVHLSCSGDIHSPYSDISTASGFAVAPQHSEAFESYSQTPVVRLDFPLAPQFPDICEPFLINNLPISSSSSYSSSSSSPCSTSCFTFLPTSLGLNTTAVREDRMRGGRSRRGTTGKASPVGTPGISGINNIAPVDQATSSLIHPVPGFLTTLSNIPSGSTTSTLLFPDSGCLPVRTSRHTSGCEVTQAELYPAGVTEMSETLAANLSGQATFLHCLSREANASASSNSTSISPSSISNSASSASSVSSCSTTSASIPSILQMSNSVVRSSETRSTINNLDLDIVSVSNR
ncbi:unnamed protein product [Protopolystoma xenopodis]|uniref:Uncharacterized protein n=1 Tax=Protopolystoma xenopodis TaxID=117903 RepID=A0A3S5CGW2_9PLAT|nr:unnamed protein product [Protopolystoma xenopodis]